MRVHELKPGVDWEVRETLGAYLRCALWSSTIDEAGELNGDDVYEPTDIDPESLSAVTDELRDFIAANYSDCVAWVRRFGCEQLGHDFWLTRNRHGAGFWDRGLGVLGDRLTDAAHVYGESYVYAIDADTFGIA